jgi:hypothetical protein
MSLKLVAVGPPSAGNSSFLSPSAVLISGSGARAYWRARAALSTDTGISGLGNQFEGRITGIDWNGSSWTVFPGQSGQTGGAEIYNEGNNFLGISKNGNRVAWNFRYHSPDTTQRGGIDTRNYQTQQSQRFYEFIPANQSAPNYSLGTELTPFVNVPNGVNVIYTPSSLRFSDDGQLTFILFQSGDNLIEVTGRPSLFFQNDGAYGNNLQNFEISGNGSSVFIFIGGSIKEFNWNGSSWQFANNILNTGPAFFPNFDGTILAAQTSDNSAVRVFKKTGSTWAQLGGDMPPGSPRLNSAGTLLQVGERLYLWDGTAWQFQWDTIGAISDDGLVAAGSVGAGAIVRYELKEVAPIFKGSTLCSAVYAGTTEAQAVYYGPQLLWNVLGWEPPAYPASLLLHMDGANNSTLFVDSSSSNITVSAIGNAAITTEYFKFGTGAASFDGSGDYLQISTNQNPTAFNFFGQDFTIDMWVFRKSGRGLISTRTAPVYSPWTLQIGPSGALMLLIQNSSSTYFNNGLFGSLQVPLNQWAHIAWACHQNRHYIFVNGIVDPQINGVTEPLKEQFSAPDNVYIGTDGDGAFNGYIDELRVVRGVADYTANFTPPTQPY